MLLHTHTEPNKQVGSYTLCVLTQNLSTCNDAAGAATTLALDFIFCMTLKSRDGLLFGSSTRSFRKLLSSKHVYQLRLHCAHEHNRRGAQEREHAHMHLVYLPSYFILLFSSHALRSMGALRACVCMCAAYDAMIVPTRSADQVWCNCWSAWLPEYDWAERRVLCRGTLQRAL